MTNRLQTGPSLLRGFDNLHPDPACSTKKILNPHSGTPLQSTLDSGAQIRPTRRLAWLRSTPSPPPACLPPDAARALTEP
jgi:hypothetical protein